MRVMITGRSGYLGTAIAGILAGMGEPGVELYPQVDRSLDWVIHLGWHANNTTGRNDVHEGCHLHTLRILEHVKAVCKDLKGFVFASSAAVYGHNDRTVSETDPVNPETSYGQFKVKSELAVRNNFPDKYRIMRMGTLIGTPVEGTHFGPINLRPW